MTRGSSRTPITQITPLEDAMQAITAEQARDLYRSPSTAETITRPDGREVTRDDVLASIDSYIETGGEVHEYGHAHAGEPVDADGWEVIADQLAAE